MLPKERERMDLESLWCIGYKYDEKTIENAQQQIMSEGYDVHKYSNVIEKSFNVSLEHNHETSSAYFGLETVVSEKSKKKLKKK